MFSFNKGQEIIYIKKQTDSKLNIKKMLNAKREVVNPLSNRCINKKTINKLPKTNLSKPEKIYPEGKIINPKTDRCVKIQSVKTPEKTSPRKIVNKCN